MILERDGRGSARPPLASNHWRFCSALASQAFCGDLPSQAAQPHSLQRRDEREKVVLAIPACFFALAFLVSSGTVFQHSALHWTHRVTFEREGRLGRRPSLASIQACFAAGEAGHGFCVAPADLATVCRCFMQTAQPHSLQRVPLRLELDFLDLVLTRFTGWARAMSSLSPWYTRIMSRISACTSPWSPMPPLRAGIGEPTRWPTIRG
mmetsp:Transcript_24524/g.35914  ORF Transcript_24524/g.35914 Transcript_24524/m.35914 type:complete len:208 (-) Transcript_24524:213-836(-)